MVGAVLVKGGRIIGRGWHHRAGEPHAEVEALLDAKRRKHNPQGATLYVTLEPCCTSGRTPPCTDAILEAGIRKVVVGATDPNPRHQGRGLRILKKAGVEVVESVLSDECTALNEAFNHWIVHATPLVTVKAAMTLDGKIATASGQSKWITGKFARTHAMKLRLGADAILVGINTVLLDDPSLTARDAKGRIDRGHTLRRIILDAHARTPLHSKVVTDEAASQTTIVVTRRAPAKRIAALEKRVKVLVAPLARPVSKGGKQDRAAVDLQWLLKKLGSEKVTSLLVEGGGEVNAAFLLGGLAHRVAFYYAPKILGGRDARHGVAGAGARSLRESLRLRNVSWRRLGPDWLLTASVSL